MLEIRLPPKRQNAHSPSHTMDYVLVLTPFPPSSSSAASTIYNSVSLYPKTTLNYSGSENLCLSNTEITVFKLYLIWEILPFLKSDSIC